VISIVSILVISSFAFSFSVSPLAYVERIGGSDVVSSSGTILVVVENPSNSGEPISKIEISIPSGFSVSSGSLSILGEGSGSVSDVSGPVVVNFSSYLKPGSRAYVFLNANNPSSAGSYTWYVTTYGISGNPVSAGAYPGKSMTLNIVSSTGFRNIPYGKVVLSRGNNVAASGIKQVSIANTTYEYILYNPIDSGETINEILLKIPPAYATVAGTTIVVSNIILGTQLANITPGAIAANIQKNISITGLSIAPGSFVSISVSLLTLPATAGNYPWELWVKGASSGQFVKVLDWPGISNAQVATVIAAPPPGSWWYMDIFPYYDVTSRTIGWNTAGSSNNVYRVNLWRTTAWAVNSDPYIEFPSGYNLSSAGVTAIQTNGAGVVTNSFSVYQVSGLWRVSNDISAAGAVNNNYFYSITNVINKPTPAVDTLNLTVGDGVTVSSVAGAYDRTIYLLPHLFISNSPAYGIDVIGGSTNTNATATYLFVFRNPTNSGDAVDKITISVPTGYSNVNVVWSNISILNSSAIISSSNIIEPSATAGSIEINFSASNPLGEGGTIYIPIVAINPNSAGPKVWGCSFSGLRDVTNITATNIIQGMTNRVTIVAVAPSSDGTNYVPTNAVSTNKSSDDIAWLIVTNGTFTDTSIVTISKATNYPAPTSSQSNSYRFVGNVYEFNSTLAPQKPVKVRIYFSNATTNFLSTDNVVANLKIAYYDPISSSWVVNASSVVGDGYVEMDTLTLGKFWIWEAVSGGGGLTNAFSIGKTSGGTISWGKLKVEIPANALVQDTWVIVDTLSTNLPFPSYLVRIGDIYSIESTSALNSSATISIYYTDEDVKGRVIDRLRIAFYNNDTKEWVVVPSTVDKVNKRVYAKTLHFSYWTLVEDRTPTSDLVSSVYIYPNPAKSSLKISFLLNEISMVYISVYDASGNKVKVIKNGEVMNAGLNEIVWNLNNEFGNAVINGTYFVKVDVKSLSSGAAFSKVYKVFVAK
jgi:hypothetical protein